MNSLRVGHKWVKHDGIYRSPPAKFRIFFIRHAIFMQLLALKRAQKVIGYN